MSSEATSNETMLSKDLLFSNIEAKNFQEVVSIVGNKMYEKGYVKDFYVEAVIEREEGFPTGLNLGDYGIAIPHTDREHVEKSVLGIASLVEPITVHSMIEPEKEVKVNLVFLM